MDVGLQGIHLTIIVISNHHPIFNKSWKKDSRSFRVTVMFFLYTLLFQPHARPNLYVPSHSLPAQSFVLHP